MAITKAEVEKFISRKTTKRERELTEKVNALICNRIDPIIHKIIDHPILEQLDRHAKNLTDTIEKAMEIYGLSNWDYQRLISDINRHIIPFGAARRDVLYATASQFIMNPTVKAMNIERDFRGNQELHDAVVELQKACAPLYEQMKQIRVLHNELMTAIQMETSGKKAYNAMVALGIDMSDFEEEQKAKGNLPAVIKLSVDVCILNGTCTEEKGEGA